ncbi:unnamed protein product, partial [Pylaiella littoralis]
SGGGCGILEGGCGGASGGLFAEGSGFSGMAATGLVTSNDRQTPQPDSDEPLTEKQEQQVSHWCHQHHPTSQPQTSVTDDRHSSSSSSTGGNPAAAAAAAAARDAATSSAAA